MANTNQLNSMYPVLRRHVSDFINAYELNHKNDWKSKALRLKYLYSETDTEGAPKDKELSELLGVSAESVRNIKDIPAKLCEELYANQDKAFLSLKGIKRIEVKDLLMKRFGFGHDEKTLMFYLDGMSYTVTEQAEYNGFCINTRYYGKGLKSILKAVIPSIKDFLSNDPFPIRIEDVMDHLKGDGADMVKLRLAEDYMLADSGTFEVKEQDGAQYVSMRWEALPSVSARQARILYDFALKNGFDAFMSKKDLIAEYNTRAYRYDGIDQLVESLSVAKNDHIEFGGNGTYRFIGNPSKKTAMIDLRAELLKYLAEHDGIAPFSDLRKLIDDNGWNYSDVTIRTYLKDDCESAWIRGEGKRTYFILKTCWSKYQKEGYYHQSLGHRPGRSSSKAPAYKVEIIDRAVAMLKAAPGNTLSKKELFDAVVDLYPNKSKNNIYKIFDEEPLLVKSGEGKGASYFLAADAVDK